MSLTAWSDGDALTPDNLNSKTQSIAGSTPIGPTTGGTGLTAYTLGDILYASATDVLARLMGNITTTRKFLRQTGDGAASAAPAWDTVTKTDVGLSAVENTALSTWAGSTAITTLGTIATGSIPYSLLIGAVPTWNQNTSGSAASLSAALAYDKLPTGGGTWANGGALSITGGVTTVAGLASTDLITLNVTGGALQTPLVGTTVQIAQVTGTTNRLLLEAAGAGIFPQITGRSWRNTYANPQATALNDQLFQMGGAGYGTTAFSSGLRAAIQFKAGVLWTDTNNGSYIAFLTTPLASTTLTEVARVGPSGAVGMLSGQKFYPDGVAMTGDTFFFESAANVWDFHVGDGTNERLQLTATGGLLTGTWTVSGAFGCNTKAAQGAYASGGALAAYGAGANGFDTGANASALHAMVVSIRAALVANGIMS